MAISRWFRRPAFGSPAATRTSSGHATGMRPLVRLTALAALLGVAAGGAAWVLVKSIAIVTNVALYHRWGTALPSFAANPPGLAVVPAAVLGGVAVGLLALWAPVIKGHGIPEAMESVLTRHSRIAPRTAVAKPMSAAIAIGTGGPFGAEGPIVVTGVRSISAARSEG